jgi:hypothetical protein
MLAVTLMASMACFAQGNYATSLPGEGLGQGDKFDFMGVKYEVISVLGTGNVYSTKAIGFETNLLNDFSKMDEEPLNNVLPIQHYVVPANPSYGMLVASVEPNIFQTVDPDLAEKITSLKIDDQSDDIFANGAIDALPTTGSTFAGLTGLTEVTCRIPGDKITEISANAFATAVYKKATLIVPEGSLGQYGSTAGWSSFLKIVDVAGKLFGDFDNSGTFEQKDVTLFKKAFKTGAWPANFDITKVDLDGNGVIEQREVTLLIKRFKTMY